MRLALSRTRKCLEMAGAEMGNGFSNAATELSEELERRPRISRRVGSARAAKTAVSCLLLTNLLSIWGKAPGVKNENRQTWLKGSPLNPLSACFGLVRVGSQ